MNRSFTNLTHNSIRVLSIIQLIVKGVSSVVGAPWEFLPRPPIARWTRPTLSVSELASTSEESTFSALELGPKESTGCLWGRPWLRPWVRVVPLSYIFLLYRNKQSIEKNKVTTRDTHHSYTSYNSEISLTLLTIQSLGKNYILKWNETSKWKVINHNFENPKY